jgi:hypothetical protein
MDLAPSAPSLNTVLAGLPLSISEELDARAVDKQVQRPVCTAIKRNDFTHDDLRVFASNVGLKSRRADQDIEGVVSAVVQWEVFADRAGVERSDVSRIEKTSRLKLRVK